MKMTDRRIAVHQLPGRIDDPPAAGKIAEDIITRRKPKGQPGLFPRLVIQVERMMLHRIVIQCGGVQPADLFLRTKIPYHDKPIPLEQDSLFRRKLVKWHGTSFYALKMAP